MKHIMVIDDSPTIRTCVEFALNGLGYSMDAGGERFGRA